MSNSYLLHWYRNQWREHGPFAATGLLIQIVWARAKAEAANRLLPKRVECPCCGWSGRKFLDVIERGCASSNMECPRCNSQPRHRALYLWLKDEFKLKEQSGVALVFAPERALSSLWDEARKMRAVRVDIEPARGVEVLADVQRLPFKSGSADLIWCHHVLQLLEDDRAAIRELSRVLRARTGKLVLSVAIAPGTRTIEYGSANKDVLYFWRIYGDDFFERLSEGGLKVSRSTGCELPAEEYRKYGINPKEEFYVCTTDSYS